MFPFRFTVSRGLLTARTGPGCKQGLVALPVRAYSPDGTGAAVQLMRELLLQKLRCRAPAVRAVSTDWYRYPSVLTVSPLLETGEEGPEQKRTEQNAVQETKRTKRKNDVYPEASNRASVARFSG